MIKALSLNLHKIMKSRNFRELFENVEYSYIEVIAFSAILLYLITPVWQIISNLTSNIIYGVGAVYYENVSVANKTGGVLGTLAIILYIGKSIVSGYKLKDFIKDNLPVLFFLIFIVLMLISTCINGFTSIALYGQFYRHESIFNYIEYFCVYFFCTSFISSKKLKSVAEYIFVFGGIITGIICIIHIDIVPLSMLVYDNMYEQVNFIFCNSNHYGYYLAMVILLSGSLLVLEKNKLLRVLCFFSYAINIYILAGNDTFGAFLACFFGLIFLIAVQFICNKKINITAVIIFALFIVEFAVSSEKLRNNILILFTDIHNIILDTEDAGMAGTARWALWKCTCESIAEKPLFGFGTEGILERLMTTCDEERTHNEFLQYASFFGIPAGIMYICGVFSVFLKGLKHKKELECYTISALVTAFTYLVSSCFGNSFFYTAPFLFIFMGLGFAEPKHK